MAKEMRAIRLTRPDPASSPVVSLVTVPTPTLLPGQLLIKLHASAIQPSDFLNAAGGFNTTIFPRIPGRDFSGVVVDGPAARIGEEVYGTSGFTHAFTTDGFHADYSVVSENGVAPKPKNLSWTQAAVVGVPFTTAALLVRRTAAKAGETVLVIGANGSVGSAVVQLARADGCRVLTASRKDSDDINISSDPSLEKVTALTDGNGVDIVIDTVGHPALVQAAIARLAKRGRLALIAAPRTGSTELAIEMKGFYRGEKTLVGCNSLLYSVEEMAAQLKEMSPLFESGALRAPKEGDWTSVGLESAVEAYGKKGAGKFVITMG
jgi:NADPH2:quinone reductase